VKDARISLASLPVKFAGLALPNPTGSVKPNYEATSLVVVSHLMAARHGVDVFLTSDHMANQRGVTSEVRACKLTKIDSDLTSINSKLNCNLRRTIL
jgi:hypothetical protein